MTDKRTLGEVALLTETLIAECNAFGCRAETPLKVSFFITRLGADASLTDSAKVIQCAACGDSVTLTPGVSSQRD